MTNHPNRSVKHIDWKFGLGDLPEHSTSIIKISDGDIPAWTSGHELDVAVADYAKTYGFNSPGDVHATASLYNSYDDAEANDYADRREFTVRSENGSTGYLVA